MTDTYKFEYAWWRDKERGIGVEWDVTQGINGWQGPVLWSHYGERGLDGDGVEYVFFRTKGENYIPTVSTYGDSAATIAASDYEPKQTNTGVNYDTSYNNNRWSDDPRGTSTSWPVEWVSQRRKIAGVWSAFSTPSVWSKYGLNGKPGDNASYYIEEHARCSSRDSNDDGTPSGTIDDRSVTSPYDSAAGWSELSPAPTETYPYIWKRTALYDPDDETLGDWSYVCETGYDGPRGNAYTLKTSPSQLLYNPNTSNWVGASTFTVIRLNNGAEVTTGSLVVSAVTTSGFSVDVDPVSGTTTYPKNNIFQNYVRFDIKWKDDNNNVIASASVPIVKYGQNGGPGSTGHVGRWYYFDGEYSSTKTYTIQDTQAPYVYKVINNVKTFFMLDNAANGSVNGSWSGRDPETYHAGNPWTPMASEQQYYIAKAFFGDSAYLGSFIINGDWMISQTAVDNSPSSDFTKFDKTHPDSANSNNDNFIPVYAVNGASGATYQNNAHVKGEIKATSGTIGGFKINSNTITDTGTTPSFTLDSTNKKMTAGNIEVRSGQNFLRDNESEYQWSGLASVAGYDNSVAVGMRHFTQSNANGGHLRLNSSNGGVFDLLTGGNTSQSLLRMGRGMNTLRVVIDGVTPSMKLHSLSDGQSGNVTTEITPSGINTPSVVSKEVTAGELMIDAGKVVSYEAGSTYTISDRKQMIIVYGSNGNTTLYLNFTAGNGSLLFVRRTINSGKLYIYKHGSRDYVLASELSGAGSIIMVYVNGDWQ